MQWDLSCNNAWHPILQIITERAQLPESCYGGDSPVEDFPTLSGVEGQTSGTLQCLRASATMLGKECPAALPHFECLLCFSDSFLQCIHSIGIIWKDNSSASRCVCQATWSAKMLSCHPRGPYVNNPALLQFLRVGLQQNLRKRDLPGKWRSQMSTATLTAQVKAVSQPSSTSTQVPRAPALWAPTTRENVSDLKSSPFSVFCIWRSTIAQDRIKASWRYQERISRFSGFSSVCQSRELNHLIGNFPRSMNFLQIPSFIALWSSNIFKSINVFLFLKGQ